MLDFLFFFFYFFVCLYRRSSLSASQSSSFAAGLTGISASDANSFNVNHPVFGGQSNANSNSFSVGQASASSQANAENGQASSGSQASIGSVHSSASSGSNVQVLSDGLIIGQPQGPRKPVWTNIGPNHDFPGVILKFSSSIKSN